MVRVFSSTAPDGLAMRAMEQGEGRPILIVHPGLDDGGSWRRVATRLAGRFRVVRLHRRQYRLDVAPCSIAQEADDVVALARTLGDNVLLVGHSSGGVVALEALVASPSAFAGAVIYEPPIHLRPAEWTTAIGRARRMLAAGRPGGAMTVFTRDMVLLPAWTARLIGIFVALTPRFRAWAPRQIDDADAINELGVRLAAYAGIDVPVVLLGGDRSPAHLADRLDALASALPQAQRIVLPGQGHAAQQRAPEAVARVIEDFADAR